MRIMWFLFILSCHAQSPPTSNKAANCAIATSTPGRLHTRLLRTNSKLAREERREYTVTPTGGSSDKKLTHFEGQYEKGNKLHPYTEPGFRQKDLDLDGALIEDLADDLINEGKSKDGIDMDLFPLPTQRSSPL